MNCIQTRCTAVSNCGRFGRSEAITVYTLLGFSTFRGALKSQVVFQNFLKHFVHKFWRCSVCIVRSGLRIFTALHLFFFGPSSVFHRPLIGVLDFTQNRWEYRRTDGRRSEVQRGITKLLTTCCEVLERWWSAAGRTINVVTGLESG